MADGLTDAGRDVLLRRISRLEDAITDRNTEIRRIQADIRILSTERRSIISYHNENSDIASYSVGSLDTVAEESFRGVNRRKLDDFLGEMYDEITNQRDDHMSNVEIIDQKIEKLRGDISTLNDGNRADGVRITELRRALNSGSGPAPI